MGDEAAYIEELVGRGGPSREDYDALSAWYSRVMGRYYRGEISQNAIRSLWSTFGESFTPKTMQGFVVAKPHGYHGDFEVIDRIYTKWIAKEEHLRKWDIWFHQLHAPQAVRNRKAYFHQLLTDIVLVHSHTSRILNVGSGSCRDVLEYLGGRCSTDLSITCVDHDAKAVEYARTICADHLREINIEQRSILRFSATKPFDLIWCGGVFDYLDARAFMIAIKRLLRFVADGGQMVLGNFSPTNPTRPIMEFGGWRLFHRSESELIDLAVQASVKRSHINIGWEPEGVNLFLHILGN